MIGLSDFNASEQIGVNFVVMSSFAQIWFGVYCFKPHAPHQALNPFAIDTIPLSFEPGRHTTASVKRCLHELPIDQIHQLKAEKINTYRFIIQCSL